MPRPTPLSHLNGLDTWISVIFEIYQRARATSRYLVTRTVTSRVSRGRVGLTVGHKEKTLNYLD